MVSQTMFPERPAPPPFLAALLILLAAPAASAQSGFELAGPHYAKLTAERLGGTQNGVTLGADRVRSDLKAWRGAVSVGPMLHFGVDHPRERESGSLPNILGDLYLKYTPNPRHTMRIGQFKTPLGMDFSISGDSLDVTKGGMEGALVLDRNLGAMLSGRNLAGGFGYDLGIFNPAGRSAATAHKASQAGEDYAAVIRFRYDAPRWHAEIAHGASEHAGGPGTRDYAVSNAGFSYSGTRWTTKLKWTRGGNLRGVPGWNEEVFLLHGDYQLHPKLQLVARHYAGKTALTGLETRLTNTYLGLTKQLANIRWLRPRLQLNYVAAGGDGAGFTGLGGFRDNAVLLQLQLETSH